MMKSKIGIMLLFLAAGIVAGYFIGRNKEKEIVRVPITINVPVPVIESDTVYLDSLIPVPRENPINTGLLEQYDKLKDSLSRREAYISSITKRRYVEKFEDSIQTITTIAEVTGFLDSIGVAYKTKPRTIPLDTVVEVEIPIVKKYRSLSMYIETNPIDLGLTSPELDLTDNIYKAGVDYTDRKNNTFGLSFSSEKRLWFKIGKGFDF